MMASMYDHGLLGPSCGQEIDPSGPAVSSYHREDNPGAPWTARWVPFVEDLRGTPDRLVHAECYAQENGLPALIAVIHEWDKIIRLREYEQWRRSRASQEQ
jgi:hypothetical protein